jgi:L-fuconolactonase
MSSDLSGQQAQVEKKKFDVPGQMAINPDWLRLGAEQALEPDLPIIDAHHHIWDPPGARYLFEHYLADIQSGHRITASVFIECHSMYRVDGPEELRPLGETEFAAGVAARSASGIYGDARLCSAIIAHGDFSHGDRFGELIDAHLAASGGRLRGFRGRVSSDPDPEINKWQTPPGVLNQPSSLQAMTAMSDRDMSLDVWAYQFQHGDLIQTCCRLPGLQMVINHAAGIMGCGPYHGRRSELFDAWSNGVRRLASYPSIVLKFSGMGMRFAGFDYHQLPAPPTSRQLAEDWRPYFDVCLEAFGPDRIMFASNFPADKGSYSFAAVWNAFKILAAGLSETEKQALFSRTASRVYKLTLES